MCGGSVEVARFGVGAYLGKLGHDGVDALGLTALGFIARVEALGGGAQVRVVGEGGDANVGVCALDVAERLVVGADGEDGGEAAALAGRSPARRTGGAR